MKIVIPAYGRHELTRRVALYYDDLGYDAIIVETPDEEGNLSGVEDKVVAQHHDEDGNVLVGRKFNDALRYAANFDDDVVLTGSDSLLSPTYLKHLDSYKEDYLEINGCHFFDPKEKQATFIDKFLCGSGKYMSKHMMDNCDWSPYDDTKARNVDAGPKSCIPDGSRRNSYNSTRTFPACLEIRNSENMWGLGWVQSQPSATTLSVHETRTIFQHDYRQKVKWWTLR